jgi:hypothetical protein
VRELVGNDILGLEAFEYLSKTLREYIDYLRSVRGEVRRFIFVLYWERQKFNGTPHFCSLPQGERRDGRKNFKRPLTLPSPAKWRGKMKRNEFNEVPCPLPQVERVEGKEKGCYSFLIVELNIFTFFLFWKISKRNSATFNCS